PGPKDETRRAAQGRGGVWSMRTAEVELKGGAGIRGTVMVGPVPLVLGASADGSKRHVVRTLTVHPDEEDALSLGSGVLHVPANAAEVLAMRPGEIVSDTSEFSVGFRGNAGVGFDVAGSGVSADAELYYQASGELTRS